MNFNLNIGTKPDYDLNSNLIKEVISMYGIQIKLILQERVNNDQVVFGDYSHLFSDGEHSHTMFALPENQEEFDTLDYGFSFSGFHDLSTINLFVHKDSIENLPGVEPINVSSRDYNQKMKITVQDMDKHLIGSLIVLPSGKILEVTNQEYEVPGVNNLYQSKNSKSAYKLSCVVYQPKLHNELDEMDTSTLGSDEESVDGYIPDMSIQDYFDELTDQKEDQDYEAEINDIQTRLVLEEGCPDKEIPVQLIDDSEKSPWD